MTQAPAAPLELVVISADSAVVFPLLPGTSVRIGRGPDNDVVIDDASVSRRHALLHCDAALAVEDLGSANGTQVREFEGPGPSGETVGLRRIAGQRVTVHVGEGIVFGAVQTVIRRTPAQPTGGAVVVDPLTRKVFDEVEKVAQSALSVLVIGETGAGKELVARAVHERSPRAKGPFVAVNCAALSPTIVESELFGHERGAFTGAHMAKEGFLEAAHGGTLFLDEIGELPLELQAKLLRVLEDRKVTRVGGRAPRAVDVRFVSATNRDLEKASEQGTFRSDLYYRLSGLVVELPPLRKRIQDIEPLAERFLTEAARGLSRSVVPSLSEEARRVLLAHPFPGNVRELKNVMERATVLCSGPTILLEHLPPRLVATPRERPDAIRAAVAPSAAPPERDAASLSREIERLERERVLDALARCAGNQTRAAEMLGISRRTLVNRLNEYGVARPRKS